MLSKPIPSIQYTCRYKRETSSVISTVNRRGPPVHYQTGANKVSTYREPAAKGHRANDLWPISHYKILCGSLIHPFTILFTVNYISTSPLFIEFFHRYLHKACNVNRVTFPLIALSSEIGVILIKVK